jgi:hypothetical protein
VIVFRVVRRRTDTIAIVSLTRIVSLILYGLVLIYGCYRYSITDAIWVSDTIWVQIYIISSITCNEIPKSYFCVFMVLLLLVYYIFMNLWPFLPWSWSYSSKPWCTVVKYSWFLAIASLVVMDIHSNTRNVFTWSTREYNLGIWCLLISNTLTYSIPQNISVLGTPKDFLSNPWPVPP